MAKIPMDFDEEVVDISSDFTMNNNIVLDYNVQLVNSHIVIINLSLKNSSGISTGTWFGSAPAKYGAITTPARGIMYSTGATKTGVAVLRGKSAGTDANKLLYYGQGLGANEESVGTLIYAIE